MVVALVCYMAYIRRGLSGLSLSAVISYSRTFILFALIPTRLQARVPANTAPHRTKLN